MKRGNEAAYLKARLQRDHPEIAEALVQQAYEIQPQQAWAAVSYLQGRQAAGLPDVPIGMRQAAQAEQHAQTFLNLKGTFATAGDNQHTLQDPGLDVIKTTGQGEGGTSAAYLAARLKKAGRDDLLEQIGPGKPYRSVRAAAIEAGIIRPVPTVRLVDDPVWAQAQAQLQEAVKGKPGNRGPRNEDGTFANAAQRAAKDPTLGGDRKPKDRKSRLIRTPRRLASPSLNPATAEIRARREQHRPPALVAAMDLPGET